MSYPKLLSFSNNQPIKKQPKSKKQPKNAPHKKKREIRFLEEHKRITDRQRKRESSTEEHTYNRDRAER